MALRPGSGPDGNTACDRSQAECGAHRSLESSFQQWDESPKHDSSNVCGRCHEDCSLDTATDFEHPDCSTLLLWLIALGRLLYISNLLP